MDHLYAFLKLLKVDRFYVVGQSTGAYHAARITLEHPEMVKALVLADSATLSPPMGIFKNGVLLSASEQAQGRKVRDHRRSKHGPR